MNAILLQFSIFFPLLCSVFLLVGGTRLTDPVTRIITFFGVLYPFLIGLWLWFRFDPGLDGYAFVSQVSTGLDFANISLYLGLNGISLPLFLLAGVVGFAAGLYSILTVRERVREFFILYLLMLSGLLGTFSSVDIFFFYFFHELALIPTFLMIGLWGGKNRHYAAMKMTIYLTVGAMLSLVGLIALYVQSGAQSFDIISIREAMAGQTLSEAAQNYTFALLLFGFGILVSIWPLHTWAPLGYGAAPTANAMLHAGVLKKFGLYGLIQIAAPLLPEGATNWMFVLAILALGNVLIIGFVTVAQTDLKQMISYSSVMHMGYCFLGLACLSVVGVGGAVFLMFAHGLSVALLFLLASYIYRRTGTFDMNAMGGLAKKAPVLSALFVTATLASIGLPGPGLANFWGELTVFMGLWQWQSWMVAPAVFGVVISAVYGLRSMAKIFFGEETEAFRSSQTNRPLIRDLSFGEKFPAVLLLVVLVFAGLWPRSLSDHLNHELTQETRYQYRDEPVFRVVGDQSSASTPVLVMDTPSATVSDTSE